MNRVLHHEERAWPLTGTSTTNQRHLRFSLLRRRRRASNTSDASWTASDSDRRKVGEVALATLERDRMFAMVRDAIDDAKGHAPAAPMSNVIPNRALQVDVHEKS